MSKIKNNQVYIHPFFHEEICNSGYRLNFNYVDLWVHISTIQPKKYVSDTTGHNTSTAGTGEYQGQGV